MEKIRVLSKLALLSLVTLFACSNEGGGQSVTITLNNNETAADATAALYQNQDARILEISACDGEATAGDGQRCTPSATARFSTTTALAGADLPDTAVLTGFTSGFYWASFVFQSNDAEEGCLLSAAGGVFEVEEGVEAQAALTVGVPHGCDAELCGEGESICGDACVDLQSDDLNCGACGSECAPGEACTDGTCVPDCFGGEALCDDACVDLDSDEQHCGACGNACDAGEACTDGTCVLNCSSGEDACSGACVDLDSDEEHCGTCGNECDSGEACTDGTCVIECFGGETLCDATCVDLNTDTSHCGECGLTCAFGEACVAGVCF